MEQVPVMDRRRNRLSPEESADLLVWLESNRPALAAKQATPFQAARMAAKSLGFTITKNNLLWMAEKHHLHWQSWMQNLKPKDAWRCPHCGLLMKKPSCPGCDLSRSRRENQTTAKNHGLKWFTNLCKLGVIDDANDRKTERE